MPIPLVRARKFTNADSARPVTVPFFRLGPSQHSVEREKCRYDSSKKIECGTSVGRPLTFNPTQPKLDPAQPNHQFDQLLCAVCVCWVLTFCLPCLHHFILEIAVPRLFERTPTTAPSDPTDVALAACTRYLFLGCLLLVVRINNTHTHTPS